MSQEEIEVLAKQAASGTGLPLSSQVTGEGNMFEVWFSGKAPMELKVAIDTTLFDTQEAVLEELKLKLSVHYSLR